MSGQADKSKQASASIDGKAEPAPPAVAEKQKARETRGIKLDYSTLGDKITMSSATCHKCKVNIPLNQMNVCTSKQQLALTKSQSEKQNNQANGAGAGGAGGSLQHQSSIQSTTSVKRSRNADNNDSCKIRFCDTCLQSVYADSWKSHQTNLANWLCPVCTGLCQCASCVRSKQRAAASHQQQQSHELEAFFERPARKSKADDAVNPEELSQTGAGSNLKQKRQKKQVSKVGKRTPIQVKKPPGSKAKSPSRSASKQKGSNKKGDNTSSRSHQTQNAELQSMHSMSMMVDENPPSLNQNDFNAQLQQQLQPQQQQVRLVQSFPVVADELWGAFKTVLANYRHELFDKDWKKQPIIQAFKEQSIANFNRASSANSKDNNAQVEDDQQILKNPTSTEEHKIDKVVAESDIGGGGHSDELPPTHTVM